ncbi:phage baseplate assembly protein [Paracandidimonas soli]|uniref:phage baseplate assembly protein n=1 Tax=Paracandidimonas soli TaxID=1917182 RepID=UPI00361C18CC
MTDEQDRVTLTVDGMDYAGWKGVEISAGIERQARDFTLGVTWRWPGSESRPLRIRHGARCQVRIGADLVLTGYVDATPIEYGKTSITTSITGRSLTEDLIDCSVSQTPGQWRGQTVLQIVRGLAQPYGISVIDEGGDGATVADHTVEPGKRFSRASTDCSACLSCCRLMMSMAVWCLCSLAARGGQVMRWSSGKTF